MRVQDTLPTSFDFVISFKKIVELSHRIMEGGGEREREKKT